MQVEMNSEQVACFEEYASITGHTFADCLYDACDDWIRAVASVLVQPEPPAKVFAIRPDQEAIWLQPKTVQLMDA